MNTIEVGKPLPYGYQMDEGVIFHANEAGYILLYSFANPTENEIAQMKEGSPFEIAVTRKGGVLWVLSKCGNLSWTDAPFHPALSPKWRELVSPNEDSGTALTLIMSDASTQLVKSLRLIGLGHNFSVKLLSCIKELAEEQFDQTQYNASVNKTMAAYTTKQLLSMRAFTWKLK